MGDRATMEKGETTAAAAKAEITTILYNEHEVAAVAGRVGSKGDVDRGYNVWKGLADPSTEEVRALAASFGINEKALEQYTHRSKKPQIRLFSDHLFTVVLAMGFENARSLSTEAVYLFLGRGWLITVHSAAAAVDSIGEARLLLLQKDGRMMSSSVDSIYYSIITGVVNSYEQLLTSMEPPQRHDEDTDDILVHPAAPDLHRRRLRHERP